MAGGPIGRIGLRANGPAFGRAVGFVAGASDARAATRGAGFLSGAGSTFSSSGRERRLFVAGLDLRRLRLPKESAQGGWNLIRWSGPRGPQERISNRALGSPVNPFPPGVVGNRGLRGELHDHDPRARARADRR